MNHETVLRNLEHELEEWRAEQRLFPRFFVGRGDHLVSAIEPLLEALAKILNAAGIAAAVSVHMEQLCIRLAVARPEGRIWIWPDTRNPTLLRMTAQGGFIGEVPREWQIPHGLIGNGNLDRCLLEAIRHLLDLFQPKFPTCKGGGESQDPQSGSWEA